MVSPLLIYLGLIVTQITAPLTFTESSKHLWQKEDDSVLLINLEWVGVVCVLSASSKSILLHLMPRIKLRFF